jgi:hypothetical protein
MPKTELNLNLEVIYMCKFFSCISDGDGNLFYFDNEQRNSLKGIFNFDSHTSIANYYRKDEDKMNKWEYDPIYDVLTCDTLNTFDDREIILFQLKQINFDGFNVLKESCINKKEPFRSEEYIKQMQKELQIGDKVKLSIPRKFIKPAYDWGYVNNGDIGIVVSLDREINYLEIKYAMQHKWMAQYDEIELVEKAV